MGEAISASGLYQRAKRDRHRKQEDVKQAEADKLPLSDRHVRYVGLSSRASNVLLDNGFGRIVGEAMTAWSSLTPHERRTIPNCGRKTLAEIDALWGRVNAGN